MSMDISRRPSRYHKHKLSTPSPPATASPSTPLSQSQSQPHTQSRYGGMRRQPTVAQAQAQRPVTSHASPKPRSLPSPQEQAKELLANEKKRQQRLKETDKEQKRLEQELKLAELDKKRLEKEEEIRLKSIKQKEEAEVAQAAKEEAELWREKQKAEKEKQKTRLKMERLRAKAEAVNEPLSPPPFLQKLGFFRRKHTNPDAAPHPDFIPISASKGEKPVIKPGGGGVVPLSDAPVSASNHGDRRVRVITQGKSILLPIKPTTTPLQLIRASVTFFDVPIDPRNSFLLEDFSKCGIQRNMRMYEHIRNVLNSWDSDDQHTLTLAPYDSSQDSKLHATWAPKSQPSGGKWSLYFSQEKGKWEKRIIKMSKEGQITAAKDEEGKGLINVCHLSDFEVYGLSRDGEKKKIRPPKKYCYAVKSLQKSTMFLGDTGFIHMFCSSDQAVARDFHDTIYKWRCWYLVNIMGEDGNIKTAPVASHVAAPLLSPTDGEADKRSSHYMLGSFNNDLQLDFETFEVTEDPKPSRHRRVPSDVPLASAIAVSAQAGTGLMSASEHTKALVARQQSIRRAANTNPPVSSIVAFNAYHRERSSNSNNHTEQPVANSSQPSAHGIHRNSSVRSTNRHSMDRTHSTRHRANRSGSIPAASIPPPTSYGKPLIDLTATYVEPPQHRGKGRGVQGVEGPLVEAATTRHEPGAIIIPEAQDWRWRGNSVGQNAATAQRTNGITSGSPLVMDNFLARTDSVRSQTGAKRISGVYGGPGKGLLGDLGGNEGFTGVGLLAQHGTKS